MNGQLDLLAGDNRPIRFVLRSSYGNDSVALIQWAREQELEGVVVLYSDTGWARRWWQTERVPQMEAWVRSLGFRAERTSSIGMEALVKAHKGWPMRLSQFCTTELKINPSRAWLASNDPDRRAVILTGVRREESTHRATAPHFRVNSPNDDGRCMISPLVEMTEAERDALLTRAGVEPLAHRSEECKCINSGKRDIRRFDEADISEIERIEQEAGHTSKGKPRTMFRPNKFRGATGIRQIVDWANSAHGKYEPPPPDEESVTGCNLGEWCGS
jgi:hypothetical protein